MAFKVMQDLYHQQYLFSILCYLERLHPGPQTLPREPSTPFPTKFEPPKRGVCLYLDRPERTPRASSDLRLGELFVAFNAAAREAEERTGGLQLWARALGALDLEGCRVVGFWGL